MTNTIWHFPNECYKNLSSYEFAKSLAELGLRSVPSVTPERPTGRWIHDGYDHPHGIDWMHCSVCRRREPYVHAAMTDYCSGCGAKMEKK